MDYAQAIGALERAVRFGIHPSLDGIRLLTDALGRPQDSFASVQVTGTNGKSSVTRLTAALLAAEGVSTAAYTSPHLESYTERIEIGGAPVSEADFARALEAALAAAEATGRGAEAFTEFEVLTAAALWLMRDRGVEIACLEVGMGGTWDATSVVDPVVAVVTGVGLDHTERLGGTVEAIAADKSRIIKRGAATVLGPGTADTFAIFAARAREVASDVTFVAEEGAPLPVGVAHSARFDVVQRPDRPGGRLAIDVRTDAAEYTGLVLTAPSYQARNVATAVAATERALGRPLALACAREACASIRFPGRFELLADAPPLVIDGAHNPQAAGVLAAAVAEAWPDPLHRPWCVVGVLADKDAAGIIAALAPVVAGFVTAQPTSERALGADALASRIAELTDDLPTAVPDLGGALEAASCRADSAGVLVTGSLYTAGQTRALVRARQLEAGSDTVDCLLESDRHRRR